MIVLVPDVGAGTAARQRGLEPVMACRQVVAAAQARIVSTHDLAARVDEGEQSRNVAIEERRILGATDEVVAKLGRGIASCFLRRLGQRVDGGSLDGCGGEPALGAQAVELKPARSTVGVVLRRSGELVFVAGGRAQRRPDRKKRQQTDDNDDQSVDRDDLDSHEPSNPPRLRRRPAYTAGVRRAYA